MPGWESKSVAIQGKQGKRTCIYQVKNTVMVSGEMSSGKLPQTPKQIYESSGSSCWRLRKSVGDTLSWKNLSGKGNRALLATAEIIYGSPLIEDKILPHLLCRPCEKLQSTDKRKSVFISTTQEMYRNFTIGRSYFAQEPKGEGL